MFQHLILAQAPGGALGEITGLLVPLAIVFLIFWFLIIRPERKKQEKHQKFLDALKVGDQVVTTGGIVGKVVTVDEATIKLRIAKDTKIELLRSSIQGAKDNLVAQEKGEEVEEDTDKEKDED
ncbi:MAG: preprotein translocase subunit YajC [Myxococcota bacterium]